MRVGHLSQALANISSSEVAQKPFGYMMASDNSVTNLDVHCHHVMHIRNMKLNPQKLNPLNIMK